MKKRLKKVGDRLRSDTQRQKVVDLVIYAIFECYVILTRIDKSDELNLLISVSGSQKSVNTDPLFV